ncbi:hypothetical protein AB0H76_26910 [Nocardia sp. NPDC050712]|uniref:hypothetical protein n=1 Tax=Nocardia sp. NPDC050712 TaxID=3155518 RepID=UPI0033C39C74
MRTAIKLLVAATLLTSCQTPDDTHLEPPAVPCTSESGTGPQMIADGPFYAFMSGYRLPPGTHIASGGSAIATNPDLVTLYLDLCPPGQAELPALRTVATDIAIALKPHDLGRRTATLSIAYVGPNTPTRLEVRDPDFQHHDWNATPDPAAGSELWELVPTSVN